MKDSPRQRKRYEKDLAKKNAKVRGAARGKGDARQGRVTEDNWEQLLSQHGRRSGPDNDAALDAPSLQHATGTGEPDGIVISVSSGRCRVVFEGKDIVAMVPPEMAVRQKSLLAVGDRVLLDHEDDVWRLRGVLPRHSVLARPDPNNPHLQRLIAANLDVVIHVVSVKAPPLRPRLIDRFWIAIQRGGAQPVLCVNKIDLLEPREREEELAKLIPYRDLGLPVIATSTQTGEGLDQMRALVQGKTAALVGHSGVGKSSILNALDTQLELMTNTLHRRGTGRHTTTASSLYDFGDGTYLIDTPGIREFGLWDLDRRTLRDYFPELVEANELCRFTDCTHVHEPDCEVKDRVESGVIDRARYETYVRLYDDLEQ